MRPTNQQQHRVGRHAELGPGERGLSGAEVLQVDARRDGDHPVDLRAVQVHQFARLVCGVGHQPVRGRDHLLLPHHPAQRLGCVALGEREVLHLGQGVRRVHQRHSPALGGQPADLPGEPVVGVHDVVPAGLVRGFGAEHPGGQRAQLRGQVLLGQALERPSRDVPDGDARGQLHDGRQLAAGGAGEDLHLDTQGGEPLAGLDDVDVHASRVARTGLLER
jgi:hypothetical protein